MVAIASDPFLLLASSRSVVLAGNGGTVKSFGEHFAKSRATLDRRTV